MKNYYIISLYAKREAFNPNAIESNLEHAFSFQAALPIMKNHFYTHRKKPSSDEGVFMAPSNFTDQCHLGREGEPQYIVIYHLRCNEDKAESLRASFKHMDSDKILEIKNHTREVRYARGKPRIKTFLGDDITELYVLDEFTKFPIVQSVDVEPTHEHKMRF